MLPYVNIISLRLVINKIISLTINIHENIMQQSELTAVISEIVIPKNNSE